MMAINLRASLLLAPVLFLEALAVQVGRRTALGRAGSGANPTEEECKKGEPDDCSKCGENAATCLTEKCKTLFKQRNRQQWRAQGCDAVQTAQR